jgi:hypothetical protein
MHLYLENNRRICICFSSTIKEDVFVFIIQLKNTIGITLEEVEKWWLPYVRDLNFQFYSWYSLKNITFTFILIVLFNKYAFQEVEIQSVL